MFSFESIIHHISNPSLQYNFKLRIIASQSFFVSIFAKNYFSSFQNCTCNWIFRYRYRDMRVPQQRSFISTCIYTFYDQYYIHNRVKHPVSCFENHTIILFCFYEIAFNKKSRNRYFERCNIINILYYNFYHLILWFFDTI